MAKELPKCVNVQLHRFLCNYKNHTEDILIKANIGRLKNQIYYYIIKL